MRLKSFGSVITETPTNIKPASQTDGKLLLLFRQIASKTVSNSIVATSLIGTKQYSNTLPDKFWRVGKTIKGSLSGTVAVGGTMSELSMLLKIGGDTLIDASRAELQDVSESIYKFDFTILCQAVDAQADLIVYGTCYWDFDQKLTQLSSSLSIDLDAATLDVIVQWDVASASNIIISDIFETFHY